MSCVLKRSIIIDGHKTSESLEDAFWRGLKEIAAKQSVSPSELVASIRSSRNGNGNLSSSIRLFVLDHYLNISKEIAALGSRAISGLSPALSI